MIKLIFLSLSILFFVSKALATPKYTELVECQKTLISSIHDAYNPKGGYFFCSDPAVDCFLTYSETENYKIELPKNSTFTVSEVMLDMADKRQNIKHHLMTWKEPKSKESVYVDIFWGENLRGFGKNLIEANKTKFSESKPMKIKFEDIAKHIEKNIATQMGLIENNVTQKSFPPGVDAKKYQESAKRRLSGCAWNETGAKIQKLADALN